MNKTNSGSLRRPSGLLEPVVAAPEMDLYQDLTVFSDLSPEQRRQDSEKVLASAMSFAASSSLAMENDSASANPDDDSGFEVLEMSHTRPLVQRPAARPIPPVQPDVACRSCGVSNPVGEIFCESCGAFVDEDPAPQQAKCPDCDDASAAGDIFCPSCGSVLSDD